MKIVFHYLKPYVGMLLICFALLFGQAVSDLSLPTLMSDIVTTGIQYSGIEDKTPVQISKEGMDFVTTFMSQEDRLAFLESYHAEGEVYTLSDLKKEEKIQTQDRYQKAIYSFMILMQKMQQENPAAKEEQANNQEAYSPEHTMDMNKLYQAMPMIKQIPEQVLLQAISQAQNCDEDTLSLISVGFTKALYKELNFNLEKIQQDYILKTGLYMLLVAFAGVSAAILVGFFASRTAAKVAQRLRHDVFEKVESFSSAEYDKFSTASLITRTTNDIQQVQMLVFMGIRMMCYAPIMGIGGILFAFNRSTSLSWIIALAVVVMFALIMIIFSIAMPKFKALQKLIDRLNLVARENLSGMLVIRAFGNEPYEEKRFDTANRNLSNTNRFVQRTMSFMMPAMMLIMNGVSLAIVWVGAHAIADSTLQIGDMMAFIQYAMQIIMSFLMIAMMFIMVPRAAVSAQRIKEVLDVQLKINDPKQPVAVDHIDGKIVFDHVNFRYENAESDVLEDISFTAMPGQTTAFIGATGSGKSTLIHLIPRFYDVTQGSITIDGIDVRDFSQEQLRNWIGFVPQKGILFSGDIASNIRYGKEEATEEEINQAIEVAQAKEFVESTDDKLQTSIAQGGTNVSGGQKQRLSIARAMIKNPPIYIFDDSFSALDYKTDAALRKALKEHTQNATVLIVAQRVSTIMNAEQIIVLEDGHMVGIGTHKQLLETCPQYREIAESQLSKEELA